MTVFFGALLIIVSVVLIEDVEGSTFKIERIPTDPVKPGRTVAFTCSIRKNVNPSMALHWVKRVGRLQYSIGRNQIMVAPFNQARRYSATGLQLRSDYYISVLTIKDASEEDIGEIGCMIQGSTSPVYSTLAVCENPESESCKCIQTTGWAKHSCWKDPPTLAEAQANFRRIIIGLAVCLAIVILFAVIMMIIVGKDIVSRIKAKHAGNRPVVNEPPPNRDPYAQSDQMTADPEEIQFVPGSAVKYSRGSAVQNPSDSAVQNPSDSAMQNSTDPYAYRRNDSLRGKNKNVSASNQQRYYDSENDGSRSNPQNLSMPVEPYDSRYSPQTPESHFKGEMGMGNSPSAPQRAAVVDDYDNKYYADDIRAYVSPSGANV